MIRLTIPFLLVTTAAFASSCATKRPTRAAIETRVAVDGSATMSGDVERVRAATMNALKASGYEIDEARDGLATKPKVDRVSRWNWSRATNPDATNAATVGAALSQGVVPTNLDGREMQGTPSDTEISVSYAFDFVPDEGGASTMVVVQPRAVLEGVDVTEDYLVAVGSERTRRKFDELFDAIRAQLAAGADAPNSTGQ